MLIVCGFITFWSYSFINPNWIIFRKAENLFNNKQYALASELYSKIQKTEIASTQLKLHLAESYISMGKFNEAVKLYKEILEKHPADKKIRLALARALQWSGDLEGSKVEYNKVLENQNEHGQN